MVIRDLVAEERAALTPDPATEPTITVERAAAILTLGVRTAYNAVDRGEIPAIRVGRRVVIPTRRFLEKFNLLETERA